ncbi:MAG: branched-chain amino acid ABC transporter permease [Rhodospirillaceae bacterium]|nr:branched-chain amino acid ABC transporter permease [Rhodospirillaceae bacterium]MYH37366.1 branched-chain amino acid ABC transporter permease [Rhodospirillaceae bacterium]MYK13121.1 branched-chain amino acid ABC transporter permease [Rhodospirillaceae bacterium]MYK58905.1 branched-chain amino acid ABC transporter permease [Rhodospirillaceae bacterium]
MIALVCVVLVAISGQAQTNLTILQVAWQQNIQLLLDGLFIGAIFALAAYGLALVWGVMNVKNLCQGEYVIMGGYIAYYLYEIEIHPFFGLPVAIVFMFGFGWAVYVLVIRRVIDRDLFTSLLATFGIAIVLQQGLNLIFGPEVQTARSGLPTATVTVGGGAFTFAWIKLTAFLMCGALALAVVIFMKRSRMGQAIRATAQDARAARVMGIDTDRVYAFTYSLNAAICGAAGVLIAMIWVIQPFYGITHSIRSFVVVTAAGFGNLPGVIMAGLGLGVAEQYSGFVLGADFQQATVVGLLLLVLIWRQIIENKHRRVVE